jgi:YhcH/YjgK/YiaL family protein
MIFGEFTTADTYCGLTRNAVWREAFDWISRLPAAPAHGIYELRNRQVYANVHGYETRPREACRYESHRVYVDVQYCIVGGEIIEWHPLGDLRPKDEYDGAKDVMHHHSPMQPGAMLRMVPGSFAIFFPEDGHMPKVADGVHPRVEKLVVKIDRMLLS